MIRRRPRVMITAEAEEKPKKKAPVYEDLIPQQKLNIADGIDLVFSVSKAEDGDPHVDIRTYIQTEKYSGPTKKGINFNIEMLESFREILDAIEEDLQKRGI